ncbi:MAG: branched-chain amino acid ABC transporter substrate-binding protein [Dehalococcoidia bacterium]|nr:branched-chain amino acid ABC transporter substrate-binding protein [Dehalococcoidia bacterium]
MRSRLAALSLCLMLMLTACGKAAGRTAVPALTSAPTPTAEIVIPPNAPLTVGVSVALSGDQQGIGRDIADAAELAVNDRGATVKGHKIVVSRKDDGCTEAQKAASAARALIADASVAGVIGPMCTTGAQAADPLYEAARVVHVSASATRVELSQQGERYFFRTAWRDDLQAAVQASYLRKTANAATAIVIDDGEPYGKGLADAFAPRFAALGGSVVSRERIERGTTDFSAFVKGVLSANPNAVVFEGLNPEAALLVKELRNQQYSGVFMAPDGVFSVRDYLQPAGPAAEGSIISGGPQPSLAFVARFQAAYQRPPDTAFVLQAYDAASALIGALDAAATAAPDGSLRINRERLAQAMRGQKLLGLTGAISFDAQGDRVGETPAQAGLVLYRVTDGRFAAVP